MFRKTISGRAAVLSSVSSPHRVSRKRIPCYKIPGKEQVICSYKEVKLPVENLGTSALDQFIGLTLYVKRLKHCHLSGQQTNF